MDTSIKRSKLAVLLGVLFILFGATKVLALDVMVGLFEGWGYSPTFRLVIGLVEMGAGFALMIPQSARWGAIALMPIMAGAAYTHVFRGAWMLAAIVPLLFLIALVIVAVRPYKKARPTERRSEREPREARREDRRWRREEPAHS